MRGDYFRAVTVNRLAPDDDMSTVLPVVDRVKITDRVSLPCDLDGTVSFKLGLLAAVNVCLIRARVDLATGLYDNREWYASTRE